MVNRTDDGGVQQDVRQGSGVAAAPPDLTVSRQPAAAARPQAPEPMPPGAAGHQVVVVGDIPAEPPGFLSRQGLLADLDRAGDRVSVIYPATGLHGLGVTQLAAAYARAKREEAGWRLVAWVSGADTGSLLAGLAAVADAAGLAGRDSGPDVTDSAATVRRWLEADGDRCLLVFDDVSDPELLRPFVPARGTARVLITSPRQPASKLGGTIPVGVFSAAEASAFLARRTGLEGAAEAAEVGAMLGHVPLALALAAPVIGGSHIGYARFLDRVQAPAADVPLTRDDGQPYPPGSVRTVVLSWRAAQAADRTGVCARVMEIMAVLSAAGVRRELLYAAGQAGVLASGRHRVKPGTVDRVLEWLGDRSLLTFSLDGHTVVPQRLVARMIRDELRRGLQLTAVCEAAAFVLDVYSRALVGSKDRRAVRGIPQQVTALVDSLAGPGRRVDEELAWLLLRLQFAAFYHLIELGDSTPQAIAVGEPLAEDLERLLGPDHPDALNARNSLAAAYLAAGRVTEAIPLFEQVLDVQQRTLGPSQPATLTSQNNLASAYQDAGRTDEAIRLYELNLEARERLLGPEHPSTLTSRGNLAAAYLAAGRVTEAIPLLEQTLAGRERVLGPDHPDTQTSRKSLARAYQDVSRGAEAAPLLERTQADREGVPGLDLGQLDTHTSRESPASAYLADRVAEPIPADQASPAARKSPPPDRAAAEVLRADFRRPPADPPKWVRPARLRRPPIDPARPPLPASVARPPAKPADHSASQTQSPPEDVQFDYEVVETIMAEDPAGIAMAYDRYAAALYGYCHWMLHDSADAAEALRDTFVVAAAKPGALSDPSELRPRLFALARNECRRRIRPGSAAHDEETDAAGPPSEPSGRIDGEWPDAAVGASDETMRFPAFSPPPDTGVGASDETMRFPAFRLPPDTGVGASDETMRFPAFSPPPDTGVGASDETMRFPAFSPPPDPAGQASDETMLFPALRPAPAAAPRASDETMRFPALMSSDPTMPFRVVSQPTKGPAQVGADRGQAELRSLISSILAGLKHREREVIELSFRHDLHDDDLAIALGVSRRRADALASRARRRLEEALSALHAVLTRRDACPELGKLLAGWDGQLTEETRELVVWHIEDCQTCAQHEWGAMRPAAFSRLLPLAPLPPELREQVVRLCTSTEQDAVACRRRAVRHAEWTWLARFPQTMRLVSWSNIRANPGAAVAVVAVTIWVVAAVVTVLVYAGVGAAQAAQPTGSPAAPAQPAQTSTATSPASPAASPATATARTSAAARPSPTVTQLATYVPPPAPSPSLQASPSPKGSTSSSPQPSKSASSSPSTSSSPSQTASPTPSTSPTHG